MRTKKQQAASRRNGSLSRGPVTELGKRTSSLNATTHGITARTLILANESQAAFDEIRHAYFSSFNPTTDAEKDLVVQLVAARWRLRRYWGSETALLDKEMERQAADPNAAQPLDEAMRCALAFESLANEGRALALLSRYEFRIARTYHDALQSLLNLRKAPKEAGKGTGSAIPHRVLPLPTNSDRELRCLSPDAEPCGRDEMQTGSAIPQRALPLPDNADRELRCLSPDAAPSDSPIPQSHPRPSASIRGFLPPRPSAASLPQPRARDIAQNEPTVSQPASNHPATGGIA
jgi:hypothetical protein